MAILLVCPKLIMVAAFLLKLLFLEFAMIISANGRRACGSHDHAFKTWFAPL